MSQRHKGSWEFSHKMPNEAAEHITLSDAKVFNFRQLATNGLPQSNAMIRHDGHLETHELMTRSRLVGFINEKSCLINVVQVRLFA